MFAGADQHERSGLKRGRGAVARSVCLALLLLAAAPALAVEVDGGALVTTTATDNTGLESTYLEQQYNLNLAQRITPYLSLRLAFQYFDFSSDFGTGGEFTRRLRQPRFDLLYARERVSARLSYQTRMTDGTLPAESFDAEALFANFAWTPRKGPGFNFTFRDERNVADVAQVGRNNSSRFLNGEIFYNRNWGSVAYLYQRSDLDSPSAGFTSVQNRHEFRGNVVKPLANDHIRLSFNATLAKVNRTTELSQGASLVEIVPPRQGLYVLDTTPEIGELDPAPDLIDGDVSTPAAPGIDIGGANTFRNVGLDMGLTTQVTRLEVTVDTVSSQNVAWQVYHSPDNLAWTRVGGEAAVFDEVFLRYTIRFPETTDLYFKAVNVSPNLVPQVFVTEVRALLDRFDPGGAGEESVFDQGRNRATLVADFRPSERVSARLEAGYTNDSDVLEGFVRREFRAAHVAARLGIDITNNLAFTAGYRWNDTENIRVPVLLRTEHMFHGGLRWNPLPTVEAAVLVSRRDEYETSTLLQSNRTTRLLVALDLLKNLRSITDFSYTQLLDPFSGFDRDGIYWSQGLEMRPTRRWNLRGSVGGSQFKTPDGESVLDRSFVELQTTWVPTAYITLLGAWALQQEGDNENFRQNYGISYTPGSKLKITASYQEFTTVDVIGTEATSFNVGYRFNRYVSVFGNLTRSATMTAGVETVRVVSTRFGLRLFF